MDAVQNLLMGFAIALTPQNLLFAFLGSVLGTLIGVLPGVGPVAGVAMLIPLTFQMNPTGAIIMLTALFYGTQYGGTITSVLLNVPGEAASAITCIEGYEMAKQGRGGAALAIAAKANPKKIRISATGVQSDEAFGILQFQKVTGAQFAMVHFSQGSAPAMTAFLGGKIEVFCGNVGDLLAQVKSGEVRILGIMDDQQSPFYPGVQTFEEQGYKLYSSSSRGFAAPAGTPKEVVNILSGAIKKAVATEEHKKRMADMGLTIRYLDPSQYAKYWSEYETMLKELLPLTKE